MFGVYLYDPLYLWREFTRLAPLPQYLFMQATQAREARVLKTYKATGGFMLDLEVLLSASRMEGKSEEYLRLVSYSNTRCCYLTFLPHSLFCSLVVFFCVLPSSFAICRLFYLGLLQSKDSYILLLWTI